MAISLKDKVCLITGADEGVGAGLVPGFARRGALVVAGRLHPGKTPGASLSLTMDVTDDNQVGHAVEAVLSKFGRIDVLVNNAGLYPRQPVEEMDYNDWRHILDVNLDGAWKCCKAVIPSLKAARGGSIINVGSINLRLGGTHLVHYLSAKGGIVGLTRGLARDLGPHNIRVNCLHLGAVLVEKELHTFPDQASTDTQVEMSQALTGRMTPESVESVFAFFASSESGDITGQCLTVDRGWTHD